jgi:hypothetical protein
MDLDKPLIAQTLERRQFHRALARPPMKRSIDEQSSAPSTPSAKRARASDAVEDACANVKPRAKVPNISASFMDRAMFNLEQQAGALPAGPSCTFPCVPNETFFFRNDGANENFLTGPPEFPAATGGAFTVASEGSFNLKKDVKKIDKWLAAMPTVEDSSEDEGVDVFGLQFHHDLVRNGSDTSDTEPEDGESEDETQPIMQNGTPVSGIVDREDKGHKGWSRSFTFRPKSTVP